MWFDTIISSVIPSVFFLSTPWGQVELYVFFISKGLTNKHFAYYYLTSTDQILEDWNYQMHFYSNRNMVFFFNYSPPPDSNWRRTNSDSALHQSCGVEQPAVAQPLSPHRQLHSHAHPHLHPHQNHHRRGKHLFPIKINQWSLSCQY